LENEITIQLLGQKYTFKADPKVSDPKEVVDLLTSKVTSIESQLDKESAKISNFAILLLASLEIINDYIELRQIHSELRKD